MINWDQIDYSKSKRISKEIVILDRDEVMPHDKSNELIGASLKRLTPIIDNLMIYSVISVDALGIQLTPKLKVIPNSHEYEYDVIYDDNTHLFSFTVKRCVDHLTSENMIPDVYHIICFNIQGMEVNTKYHMEFHDDDVEYFMREFPYHFKTLNFIMSFFIKQISKSLNIISLQPILLSNDDPFFLEEPIDKNDEKMKTILHNIYSSKIARNFNR